MHDPVGVKIACLYQAYRSFDRPVSFYVQEVDGRPTAYFSVMARQMHVAASEGFDAQEVLSFRAFAGQPALCCDAKTAQALGLRGGRAFCWCYHNATVDASPLPVREDTVRRVATILQTGLEVDDLDELVADLTLRYYHEAALLYENGYAAGVLLCCVQAAFLNGLCTLPEQRGRGYGSAVLKRLLQAAGRRTTYLFCREETVAFYERNGFTCGGEVINFGSDKHENPVF